MIFRPKYKWPLVVSLLLIAGAFAYRAAYTQRHASLPLADNMIVLDQPLPNATISSPLKVSGKARGSWFFEASFPVILTDWNGVILAQAPAQAQADWMTTDWVPFEATLTFTNPAAAVNNRGTLILRKDNPSGLPQYDDARQITVFFK